MKLRERVKRIENQLFPEHVNEFANVQFKGTARIAEEALNLAFNIHFNHEIINFFRQIFYGYNKGSLSESRQFEMFNRLFKTYIKQLLEIKNDNNN